MLDIPSISAVVASIGVLVGVTLAYLEVRTLVRQRQTDLVTRLYSTRSSKEFLESWKKVMAMEYEENYDHRKWYERLDFIKVAVFFEGIGILLHRKLIDISLVDDLFSYLIKTTWEKMKPFEEDIRRYFKAPQIGEWFEYLYNEMQKREQSLQQTPQ